MRILVADDDAVSRRLTSLLLESVGHDPILAATGGEAWETLQRSDAPRFAVLDWRMPGIDGVTLCRQLRASARHQLSYLIIITSKSETADLVAALDAGANDFLSKPFAPAEFLARVMVGVRTLSRQDQLLERLMGLEALTLAEFAGSDVVPVCMYCKSIRDRSNRWVERESFILRNAGAPLSHGICPSCESEIVLPMLERARAERPTPIRDSPAPE